MSDYMKGLVNSTRTAGARVEPHTIHSNGGLMSVKSVLAAPVRTCLSGPAAGVIGAAALGLRAGFRDLITCDVGGTSLAVSIRSEEPTSELQSLMRISYAVFCLQQKTSIH